MGKISDIFMSEYGTKLERKGSVTLETDRASYAIVPDYHRVLPEQLGVLRNVDAVILEAIVDDNMVRKRSGKDVLVALAADSEYHDLFEKIALERKLVFIGDVTTAVVDFNKANHSDALVRSFYPGLEAALGVVVLAALGRDVARNRRYSRRGFLWRMGTLVLGAHAITPEVARQLEQSANGDVRSFDANSKARKRAGYLGKFVSQTHPELRTGSEHLRDQMIAQKAETVARMLQSSLKRKPKLALFIGAGHVNIGDALVSSEKDRVERLRSELKGAISTQNVIIKVDFSGQEPKVAFLYDPALHV